MSKKQRRGRQCWRVASAAILLVAIVLTAATAHATLTVAEVGQEFNLAELIETQEAILIGDKKFDMWDYVRADIDTNNMPEAAGVNIIATQIDGNWGITVQGGFGDVPGDNFFSDASLFYRVMVMDENLWISDAHLSGNLDIVGSPDATAMISVTEEWFIDNNGQMGAQVGQRSITAAQAGGEKILDLEQWIFFEELHKSLKVRKDIIAFAEEGVSFPIASLIDQTYSQVPEPVSATLLATAVLMFGLRRRRSR